MSLSDIDRNIISNMSEALEEALREGRTSELDNILLDSYRERLENYRAPLEYLDDDFLTRIVARYNKVAKAFSSESMSCAIYTASLVGYLDQLCLYDRLKHISPEIVS